MRQVLFHIPGVGLPVYGYGLMLCLALFACGWYAARMVRKQGKDGELMWDLLVWLVLPGILTARLFYVIQYREQFNHWTEIFQIWEGGLVVYGSVIGAMGGLLVFAYRNKLRVLWLMDIAAPVIGIGLAFGRIGCLLNGCCYGDYCEQPWAVQFPAGSPAHQRLVLKEFQSSLGFVIDANDQTVEFVEPETSAAEKGLRVGDRIVAINEQPIRSAKELSVVFDDVNQAIFNPRRSESPWPMKLTAQRDGAEYTVYLDAPRTLTVHPTQLYSSINGVVLFFFLASYYPLRRRDGEVIALFAMLYSVNRFLVEYLRFDELPFRFDGLTISQNISVLMFISGLVLFVYVSRRKSPQPRVEYATQT